MKITLDVEGKTEGEINKYREILEVLISKGALDGVRAGSAILHFDHNCLFQGVELSYFPWRRKHDK